MAHFCTKCASPSDDAALFCEHCGAALRAGAASVAVGTAATPISMASRRSTGVIVGVIAGVLVAVALGVAVLVNVLAPEPASSASFTRAVNEYLAKDPAANDGLICADNLRYQSDPMRVDEYDHSTRQWMELLSQAGVYAAATTEHSGGFFSRSQFVYQITDIGRASVRNNKLCIASGVLATSATGFEQVQKSPGQAQATATLTLKQEAAWLAKSPQRAQLLQSLNMATLEVQLPLSLVDKKWQVDMNSKRDHAKQQQRGIGLFGAAGVDAAAVTPGLFDRLRAMFRFGRHPLEGKWSDDSGQAQLQFTADSIVQNGVSSAASFKVNGDTVIVSLENGFELVCKMRDANHAALSMGFVTIILTRSQ